MRILYFVGGFVVGIFAERHYKPQIQAACKKARQSLADLKGEATPAQD